jgi:hypothetical protein
MGAFDRFSFAAPPVVVAAGHIKLDPPARRRCCGRQSGLSITHIRHLKVFLE